MKHIPPQQLQSIRQSADETTIHTPVLLEDTVRLLNPQPGETYLDLTAGYGGHARAIVALSSADHATLVDRDEQSIASLTEFSARGATIVRSDFATFAEQQQARGVQYDMVLVDLGVSSPQFDIAERGFSFQHDGPLDMRMDRSLALSADVIVNRSTEKDLSWILEAYGEERPRQAARIAKAICRARPIRSTSQLATVITSLHRGPYQRIHPATRTFQAVRIAVNDEVHQIERMLATIPDILSPKGRVAIISFHSLEDRLVKHRFAELSTSGYESELTLLTPKPIRGSTDVHNPRARSALLRGAVKK